MHSNVILMATEASSASQEKKPAAPARQVGKKAKAAEHDKVAKVIPF
jgi:hypothetical protein